MRRLTPELALAAYEATGYIPIRDIMIIITNSYSCACALTAYCKFAHLDIDKDFDIDYTRGFMFGFDGDPLLHQFNLNSPELFETGFNDGVAVWNAVKHLANKEVTVE